MYSGFAEGLGVFGHPVPFSRLGGRDGFHGRLQALKNLYRITKLEEATPSLTANLLTGTQSLR